MTYKKIVIEDNKGRKYYPVTSIKNISDIEKVSEYINVDKNISRTSTIVIANYDSHENSKKGADVVVKEYQNASRVINEAIESLRGTGGEVKLLEGEYRIGYGIKVDVDNVHLTGIPGATILKQDSSWSRIEPVISTELNYGSTSKGLKMISNLHIKGAGVSDLISAYNDTIIKNCFVENADTGIYCRRNAQAINCISKNCNRGFGCDDDSEFYNCISVDSNSDGFTCWGTSIINNCISKNSGSNGFVCWDSSTISNCISENSGISGFRVSFEGVCVFNVLKGDTLDDRSSAPAIVEYNIIQEVE